MSFERALKRFLAKTPSISFEGAVELAQMELASHSESWRVILSRLARHRGGIRILEEALARVGPEIDPVVEKALAETKGEKAVPLLRVLGTLRASRGRALYRSYAKKRGIVRHTALRLLAQHCPSEAAAPVYKAAELEVSEELFIALLHLRTEEGFHRAQRLAHDHHLGEWLDGQLTIGALDHLVDCAERQLRSTTSLDARWPYEKVLITSEICNRLPHRSVGYLILLLQYPAEWIRRRAAISLSQFEVDEGFAVLKEVWWSDRDTAKAALESCRGIGPLSYFDWFSERLSVPPHDHSLSPDEPYGYVISRLCNVVSKDERWQAWLQAHAGEKYAYLDPLRPMTTPAESLLQAPGPESLMGLEKLAEEGSPLVPEWIQKRLNREDGLSRAEYFSMIESLRTLGDAQFTPLVEAVVEKFQPTGFAKDFAREVSEHLARTSQG